MPGSGHRSHSMSVIPHQQLLYPVLDGFRYWEAVIFRCLFLLRIDPDWPQIRYRMIAFCALSGPLTRSLSRGDDGTHFL